MSLRRLLLAAAVAASALLVPTTPADAAVVTPVPGLAGAGNGIVVGPDGNTWVAEETSGSVARLSPSGAVLGRWPVGSQPTSMTTSPDGKVWVAVTGAKKLTWFDALSPAPSTHDVSTGLPCGPVGLAATADRVWFSTPSDGSCGGGDSLVASVAATGGAVTSTDAVGQVLDLELAGGKLYAAGYSDEAVYRLSLGLTVETEITAPPGSSPDGIASDGAGNLYVTAYGSSQLLRVAQTQNGGTAQVVPTPAGVSNPFGILVTRTGRILVASSGSASLLRLEPGGTSPTLVPLPAGTKPWQLAEAPNGDVLVTDQEAPRLLRYTATAPTVAVTPPVATSGTTARVVASVDPRGSATQVTVELGTTAAYGATTAPISVPAGVGPVSVTLPITGLKPAKTYYLRVRATNADGTSTSSGTLVTTPLGATARLKARSGATTVVSRLTVSKLRGGETVKVSCKGRGCPFGTVKAKKVDKGSYVLAAKAWKGRPLAPGTKITVTVTKRGATGVRTVFTVRKGKAPLVTRT